MSRLTHVFGSVVALVRVVAMFFVMKTATEIRMHATTTYGRVIHEFDPWFNYRATEQLVRFQQHHGFFGGITTFNTWYDDKVWSPLGRPVGTTIYPGMQVRFSCCGRACG
jgi:dolichyl-diphosphooligosaccharide--protein glycosyltransferase